MNFVCENLADLNISSMNAFQIQGLMAELSGYKKPKPLSQEEYNSTGLHAQVCLIRCEAEMIHAGDSYAHKRAGQIGAIKTSEEKYIEEPTDKNRELLEKEISLMRYEVEKYNGRDSRITKGLVALAENGVDIDRLSKISKKELGHPFRWETSR